MKLIISFSGRKNGNCDSIATYIAEDINTTIYLRELNVHECSNCEYECFADKCKYREDDIYRLYESMTDYDKVILVVPMYCGNPASLYFKFQERCQDFFSHNEEAYEKIISKLYIIGVYGSKEENPEFLPVFEKWFSCSEYTGHVLGIERHKYHQSMGDSVLAVEEIRREILKFVEA